MRRRRQIRIAHAEIDDVGAGVARHGLGAVDLLEHIRRQAPDAVEFFHGQAPRPSATSRPGRAGREAFITGCGRRQRVGGAGGSHPRWRGLACIALTGRAQFRLAAASSRPRSRRRRCGPAACHAPPDRPAASPAVAGVPSGRPPTGPAAIDQGMASSRTDGCGGKPTPPRGRAPVLAIAMPTHRCHGCPNHGRSQTAPAGIPPTIKRPFNRLYRLTNIALIWPKQGGG